MKAIWNNIYTPLEWKFIKITLVIFWLKAICLILIENNSIPIPTGILGFLPTNTNISFSFKLICIIAIIFSLYFYVLEKKMVWATLFLFIISVLVFTIEESNGIFHRNGLFSFVFFAQFWAYIYKNKKIDSNIEKNRVQFSVQVIAVGYTLSAISKLNVSGINWILDSRKMPLQIMKSFYYSYVDHGNYYFIEKANEVINSFNNNIHFIYLLLAFSLFLELFALISIISKKHALVYGVLMLLMHIGIYTYMNIKIVGIIFPMMVFMLNPLYICWVLIISLISKIKSSIKIIHKKIFFSILIFYSILEISLRISGKFTTSNEKSIGFYHCQYRQKNSSWYYYYKRNWTHYYKQVEFEYTNVYNELGSREKPFISFLNDTISNKIVCLGDSFTHGDGTCYDSSWVRQFERKINKKSTTKTRLYNAGTCGSDVFFNNKLLVNDLIKMKPKLVIECVNTSDILDIIKRGGNERFNDDRTTSGKVGPRWEIIYQYSFVFRGIIHVCFDYNDVLIKKSDYANQESKAIQMIKQKTIETALFCKKNGIPYVLFIQPIPVDLKINQAQPLNFINQLAELPYSLNLFEPMHNYYNINPLEKDSWVLNGHFNSNGYLVLGNFVFEELNKNKELQTIFN